MTVAETAGTITQSFFQPTQTSKPSMPLLQPISDPAKTLAQPLKIPATGQPGDRLHWGNLSGSATALAIVSAAQQDQGFSLVITADAKTAARLENELLFFTGNDPDFPILHLPDWETLPYDWFSPHQDIISERLRTLHSLPHSQRGILIAPTQTLMKRLPPATFIVGNTFVYRSGDTVDINRLRSELEQAGYRAADTVYEHGEFAVRGALIDIFPMGSSLPIRLDLFDNEIDSLRTFDPDTQRTVDKKTAIHLLPAREFPLNKAAIKTFLDHWHSRFDNDPRQCNLYQSIKSGSAPGGIEYYLPLFFDNTATLFDYLPDNTLLFTEGDIGAAAESFWHEANERYTEYRVDPTRPLLPPGELFLSTSQLFSSIKQLARVDLHAEALPQKAGHHDFDTTVLPDISIDAKAPQPLAKLQTLLTDNTTPILFCAESPGRREALLELLGSINIKPREVASWFEFVDSGLDKNTAADTATNTDAPGSPRTYITVYPLERGLRLHQPDLILISETELFDQQVLQRRRRSREQESSDQIIKNLTELRIGAPVVHIDHGVGRYRGLETLVIEDETAEFLMLEYAGGDKLYVPVANLHLISRYSGSDESVAPLHRLGSETWQKAKTKAAKQIRDTAAELLEVYAHREARQGYVYQCPEEDYRTFCAGFPFEETPDQLQTITAVHSDMHSAQPMDRLVCGDVGFGKTEVAMRAAFIAVSSGKQITVLVPTTLLAQQHYDNFCDRFADWPVQVDVLSRFRSAREQNEILEKVASGKIDILIGTHKLLNSTIKYHNLGLLIIDEEHRFGVQQKEKVKALRHEIDILTLTATPIPRTLNMAMGGLRDLSIIATPPAKRLAVKTFVHTWDQRLIREAILRETLRGGQVYFLHNDVKTIGQTATELETLIPEARVGIAHGQLRERELENVMSDFYHQRFNVLVCSTIIETGIDIPSANTIIIERADKLGLAQLHQLRGRVGRSHHQAYAYLLTPEPKQMSSDAHKRLEAIEAADHLGSGFTLATHDLEIRGAGELLGKGQSGHISTIGFSLYMELLDRAVQSLRDNKTPDIDLSAPRGTEVNLNIPALIPDDYVPDVHTRLMLYKRLASATDDAELLELQVEMIDRFSLLPEPLKNLFRVASLRLRATRLGIHKIEAGAAGGTLEFGSDTQVEPLTIVQLVQQQADVYRLQGATQLKFAIPMFSAEDRLATVTELLDHLSPEE